MTEPDDLVGYRRPNGTFAPGRSGNPRGRPPGAVSLAARLQAMLAECPPGVDEATWAEALVAATLRDAVQNDGPSRRLVWELIEGKPRQAVEVDLPSGGAVLTIAETVAVYASTFALMLEGEAGEAQG